MCAQRRLRSAWASAQSDQSLRCPHEESLGPYLPTERTAQTLIILGGCPGWSESSLGAHVSLLVLSRGGSFIITGNSVRDHLMAYFYNTWGSTQTFENRGAKLRMWFWENSDFEAKFRGVNSVSGKKLHDFETICSARGLTPCIRACNSSGVIRFGFVWFCGAKPPVFLMYLVVL